MSGKAVKATEEEGLELEKIVSEEEDYESSPAHYDITTYPADYTLQGLYDLWNQKSILIPRFQRQFVWKQAQASKLIESFLVGLPVPAIFLYTERKSENFLVVDGQQRLKSIFYFFDGYFGEENEDKGSRKVFRLKGLSEKSKWHEKTFDEFDEQDQKKLKNSVLRAFIVKQHDPDDDTSIYHIFERLNTGGTLLTNQEVRNCVYGGTFNDLLLELNENHHWREILGKPDKDPRQRDIELMLRFFALQDLEKYEKPMKDHLSKFMRRHRSPTKKQLEDYRSLFETTCEAVVLKLGKKPFHVRAGLNAAVYDSVMVAFSKHLEEIPKTIKRSYDNLVQGKDYVSYTSSGTTSEEAIRKRFGIAEHELFKS